MDLHTLAWISRPSLRNSPNFPERPNPTAYDCSSIPARDTELMVWDEKKGHRFSKFP